MSKNPSSTITVKTQKKTTAAKSSAKKRSYSEISGCNNDNIDDDQSANKRLNANFCIGCRDDILNQEGHYDGCLRDLIDK